ncbi:MAG: 4-hydroxythreonine-4-phosphate dehydrogenase PdxA [Flavobacteriaceae bacterium]|nr:4-hydroxythreonine-4-phosphate dehydrogenase PdxA [Flavobacteriaceae bacterium]
MNQSTPIIAISIGDPNGIGPEIIFKALGRRDIQQLGTFVIFAPGNLWNFYKKTFNETLVYSLIDKKEDIKNGKINVLNYKNSDFKVDFGLASKQAGKVAFDSLNEAAMAVKKGFCDLLITAPINKAEIQADEFDFPGHTEFLEHLWGGKNLMFMVHENIKVGLVTQHIPVKEISNNITKNSVISKLKLLNQSLKNDFNIQIPKIAVTGLNPHSGDQGLIGHEEIEQIIPALQEAIDSGLKVFGPYPADSFFDAQTLKKFDGVLAMYHDQGLTPFKTIAGIEGVNFTAGLPFVRTSPDHGVGYDIANQFIANETSMVEAIYTAIEIWQNRKMNQELHNNALQVDPEVKKSRKSARYE